MGVRERLLFRQKKEIEGKCPVEENRSPILERIATEVATEVTMMEVMPTPTPAVVATITPAAGMASTIVERVDPRLPAARGTARATTTTRAPPPPSTSRVGDLGQQTRTCNM